MFELMIRTGKYIKEKTGLDYSIGTTRNILNWIHSPCGKPLAQYYKYIPTKVDLTAQQRDTMYEEFVKFVDDNLDKFMQYPLLNAQLKELEKNKNTPIIIKINDQPVELKSDYDSLTCKFGLINFGGSYYNFSIEKYTNKITRIYLEVVDTAEKPNEKTQEFDYASLFNQLSEAIKTYNSIKERIKEIKHKIEYLFKEEADDCEL